MASLKKNTPNYGRYDNEKYQNKKDLLNTVDHFLFRSSSLMFVMYSISARYVRQWNYFFLPAYYSFFT